MRKNNALDINDENIEIESYRNMPKIYKYFWRDFYLELRPRSSEQHYVNKV